jgi:hypothetical protein
MKYLKLVAIATFTLMSAIAFGANHDNSVTVTGRITCGKAGIEGVAVTDGSRIVVTEKNGKYSLPVSPDAKFVYYTLPSGYNSPLEGVIPQFFATVDPSAEKQKVDFELTASPQSQDKHTFIVWADPQVLRPEEEFALMAEVADDVRATVQSYDVPVHAISAGDNVFDRLNLYEQYKSVAAGVGVPFYHSVGNHDMDYNGRSNELSDESFSAALGPSHYSFNVGRVHYVVLKDVFYFGYGYRYMGYVTERQLHWLEQDLALIPTGSTVVVTLHIPTTYGDTPSAGDLTTLASNSVMNNKALYNILEPYTVHIMAGHSHTQWNTPISDNILEHTHAAASAAWWQGEIALDGTPKGYTVYEVDGDDISWYFKGVGLSRDEQIRIYYNGAELVANVFNYDPQWKVEWRENGRTMGEMEKYWGADPLAMQAYPPGGSKVHSWLSYGQTGHLFKATPADKNAKLEVVATDRFGNTYTKHILTNKDN